jgi:hypothetical protein
MSLSDDEIIGSDDEISESERQAFIKLVRDEEIRRMTRGGTLDDLVAMDCEIAEKDPDLLALYHAGVEQMRQSDEAKVAFNEVIDRLARVIFPGRFVDCIKPQMDEQKDPNIADMQLIVLVVCQLIALYIRDHPVEASDSLKATYQLYRMMSSKPTLDCTIL